MSEYKSVAELAAETKAAFQIPLAEAKARIEELEQKMARRGSIEIVASPSIGEQFTAASEVKSFLDAKAAGSVSIEVKANITSATTDADGSAGDLLTPYRDNVFVTPKRRMTLRSLLPVIQVTGNSVEVPKQTGYTNSAATVAEGATKPQSELKYDMTTVPIRTIAHWTVASRQIVDDVPQLRGLIDTELLYGLSYAEELQILHGDNSGTNLNGLYTQATAYSAGSRVIANANKMDVIATAIYQQGLTNLPATGIVIHPTDWMDMLATKDSAGNYILGFPQDGRVQPNLFGLPVIVTEAMLADKFLVGHFPAATLYDRWSARCEISLHDSTNFRSNLATILCEERVGLALKTTLAMHKGDFSDAVTDLTS